MSETIKVSIIVPIYNVEKYLERCLNSIVSQTYLNTELILINDGSTDRCTEICHEFINNYPDTILVEKENGGLVSAWMAGLPKVSGDFICFLDSDDYIAKDYISLLVNALEKDIDMVCMNCIRHFDDNTETMFRINTLPEGVYEVNDELRSVIVSDHGATYRPIATCRWAKIVHSDLVFRYSKYCSEQIVYGEDQQLTVALIAASKKIKIIDEYKYFYQFNETSIINSYKKDLWNKINLLIETMKMNPIISSIPGFERQINTQFLIYCNECLKNEYYYGHLKNEYFFMLAKDKKVQDALKNYSNEKMRFLDRKMLEMISKQKFSLVCLLLKVYGIYCKIKKMPL